MYIVCIVIAIKHNTHICTQLMELKHSVELEALVSHRAERKVTACFIYYLENS